jgi:prolyl oligopeptidase
LCNELEMSAESAIASITALIEQDKPAEALHALFDAHWEWSLREDPAEATALGDKRYDDRWPEVSQPAFAARQAYRLALLELLSRIDPERLESDDWLNHRLLRGLLEQEAAEQAFQWHLAPINPRDGIQDAGSLAEVVRFETARDYQNWLARLRAFPKYMDQTIELMREGLRQHIVQPAVVMQRVPGQIEKQLVEDPRQSQFFKPFLRFPESISAEARQQLAEEGLGLISQQVLPAYRKFGRFFREEYLPGCLDGVGAWRLPRGEEFYAQRARRFTTTQLSPRQIHEIGLAEVARIKGEMESLVRQVGFKGSFQEFLKHLRTSDQFHYKDPQELLSAYRDLCKRIDPELPRLFRRLPRIPYGVEPIPDLMAPDTTTAYYRPPSADGLRAGVYFVNLYRPEERPKYEMEALSLHEAVPGHHLQIALATELDSLPNFRRFLGITAYVEGWALYAESLGPELGCYKDPYSKFGQLTYEMWRAVRLVVDTGMHAFRWSRQQAIDYFAEHTAKTELDIANEVDRYISWPGQALAYKIGELKIKELRARAQKTLGSRFDLREFHDVVLRQGAVPLDVLEEIVLAWVARQMQP